ncbi:MAG TPA: SusC/RagA family TonB-linked outer membrane protein [Puia sp.]|nr:SusC/RagA family TonB-linked outer membrane protein [Puia sp.]
MRKFLSLFAVLVLVCSTAFSQSRNVTGKVTDQQNQPVPFASVRIKGSKVGVPADADGNFAIKAKTGDVLVVTGTGVTSKEVTVSEGGLLTIQVARKESNLTEVVVTALGIQKQAKSLGYSTDAVNGKDIIAAKPYDLANGLTGKVSGLEINTVNNGLFAPSRITLRGNRSLTGNNTPLIVLDGAIFYNDISTINPDDIQDVTVLKGSSASAIYGSDASNGVMIITTKRGIRNKSVITVSSTLERETVAYLPAFQTSFGNSGGEYYIYSYNDLSTYIPFENQNFGPAFAGYVGLKVPAGRPLADGSLQMINWGAVKNQKKDFFDVGVTQLDNFSYQAGDETSRFFLSGSYTNSKNPMPGDKGIRDVFRVGGSKTYGIFSADFTLSYTYRDIETTNTGSVYNNVLNSPVDDPLSQYKNWQSGKYSTPSAYYNDYFVNPYWVTGNDRYSTINNNIQGNGHLQLKPTKWLTLSYRLALNNLSQKAEHRTGAAEYDPYVFANDTVYFENTHGTGTVPITAFGTKWIATNQGYVQPYYNASTFSNFLVTSDFVASFNKDVGRDWNINANAGTTYIDNQISYLNVNANNIFFPVYNITSLTGIPTLGQYFEEARKLGYFGEAQLGYKGLAYLHGSYRTDIDSRLSKSNRFIPYYDVDASLVLSELIPSLKNGKFLEYAKLRGAYSVTGNASALAGGSAYIADGAYKTTPTLYSEAGFPFSGLGGYLLNTNIANPNIKPEQVKEKEIGAELGFLNSRITLSGAYYDQKLTDGIVPAALPSSTGYTSALVNAANTDNKGYELDFKGKVVQTRNIVWSVNLNYSHNECRVISINGGQQQLAIANNTYAVVGQLYPLIEVTDWVRDPQGHVVVNAVTGLPSTNPNPVIAGNATPKDIVGISTSVTWKGFTITATADYRGGYKTYNSIGQFMSFTGSSLYSAATNRQRFVFPNSVIETSSGKFVPNTTVTTNDANYNLFPGLFNYIQSPYVTSASAWKLREVSLSYSLPKSALRFTRVVQTASLTIFGRNLLMLRPKTNQWTDPEYSEDTSNAVGENSINQAPPTRIMGATLAITF